jgi:uncharacterized protein YgiM (DUF1202 family)
MGTNNYNKYFNKVDNRKTSEPTNDKKISRTSSEIQMEDMPKKGMATQIEDKSELKAAVVSTYKLNIRQSPNTLSSILCTVDPGTQLMVDSIDGGWAHVYTPHGIEGYAMKDYIILSQL